MEVGGWKLGVDKMKEGLIFMKLPTQLNSNVVMVNYLNEHASSKQLTHL